MMELVYIYILIGLIGGVTAGMLGLGGGIIFVPGLLLVHKFSGLFDGYQLQSAVYTSLICIIFAGSTSSYLHFKNKLIEFKFVKKYANIRNEISKAVSNYSKEVRKIKFPNKNNSY